MKALKLNIFLSIIALFAFGCTNQTSTENYESQEQSHSDSDIINLNNGEKWMVNEEMKPFILEAESILIEYIETGSVDYQTLATQLKDKNSGLIKSCTMTGESHDELHKWLHPHMDLIKDLGQESDLDKAQSIVDDLQTSFNAYHQYFQ